MLKRIGKSISHLKKDKLLNLQNEYDKVKNDCHYFIKHSTFTRSNCLACGNSSFTAFASVYGFDYMKCDKCGLVMLNPLPNKDDLSAYYARADFNDKMIKHESSETQSRIDNIMLPRYDFAALFKPQITSWLDISTGTGEMLCAIKDKVRVTGTDSDLKSIEFAKNYFGIDIVKADVTDFVENEPLDYDVVSLYGVLEHLVNPKEVVDKLYDKMPKGSLLAFLVPASQCVSCLIQKDNPDIINRHMYPPAHISLWDETSLDYLLGDFKIRGIWKYGMDCFELFKLANKHGMADKMLDSLDDLQAVFDKMEMCDEIMVVAEK